MEILNIQQNSPEWYEARQLKLTASKATAIGNCGAGLDTLVLELVSEYSSSRDVERYTNPAMEEGNELEDQARFVYTALHDAPIKEVGFCVHNDYVGCSPDGFVGEDGLIEIKCKQDKGHLSQMIKGLKGIESSYIWQMQMQMLITGRKWCDFVSYNPYFDRKLLVYKIAADKTAHEKLLKGFKLGEEKIKEALEAANEKG